MKIIVGLGNPGKRYLQTRHNAGFMALDHIHEAWQEEGDFSTWQEQKKFQAEVSEGRIFEEKVFLVKPLTYMNNSGQAVRAILDFYQREVDDLIVLHDEIDLPFGTVKIKEDGGTAGHNGLKSIVDRLGTKNFMRVRIGVGKDDRKKQGDTARFVLRRFNFFEKRKLSEIWKQTQSKLEQVLDQ